MNSGVYFTNRAIPMSHADLMRQKRIITASAVNPAKFPPRTESEQTANNKLRRIACVSINSVNGLPSTCSPTNQNL